MAALFDDEKQIAKVKLIQEAQEQAYVHFVFVLFCLGGPFVCVQI